MGKTMSKTGGNEDEETINEIDSSFIGMLYNAHYCASVGVAGAGSAAESG